MVSEIQVGRGHPRCAELKNPIFFQMEDNLLRKCFRLSSCTDSSIKWSSRSWRASLGAVCAALRAAEVAGLYYYFLEIRP